LSLLFLSVIPEGNLLLSLLFLSELKKWTRARKIELIERENPTWEDLFPFLIQPRSAVSKADPLPG